MENFVQLGTDLATLIVTYVKPPEMMIFSLYLLFGSESRSDFITKVLSGSIHAYINHNETCINDLLYDPQQSDRRTALSYAYCRLPKRFIQDNAAPLETMMARSPYGTLHDYFDRMPDSLPGVNIPFIHHLMGCHLTFHQDPWLQIQLKHIALSASDVSKVTRRLRKTLDILDRNHVDKIRQVNHEIADLQVLTQSLAEEVSRTAPGELMKHLEAQLHGTTWLTKMHEFEIDKLQRDHERWSAIKTAAQEKSSFYTNGLLKKSLEQFEEVCSLRRAQHRKRPRNVA